MDSKKQQQPHDSHPQCKLKLQSIILNESQCGSQSGSQSQSKSLLINTNKHSDKDKLHKVSSINSLSSILSSISTNGPIPQEIYENYIDDENIKQQQEYNENNIVLTPSPHSCKYDTIITPQIPKQNNNNDEHPLSPHITALTRLYINNETDIIHPNLSPSPTDNEEQQQYQHQDIKLKLKTNLKQNEAQVTTNNKTVNNSLTNYLWSAVTNYMPYSSNNNDNDNDNDNDNNNDNDDIDNNDELKLNECDPLQNILSSPKYMENAISIYGTLQNALDKIEKRTNMRNKNASNKNHKKINQIDKDFEEDDLKNDQDEIISVIGTLISSASTLSGWININNDKKLNKNVNTKFKQNKQSRLKSAIYSLSSSISYLSWKSIHKLTPYIYNMVEICILEIYDTIKDIVEYYDPDPKSNILILIINKMTEIIQAIKGLLALSECWYNENEKEDQDDEDKDDENTDYYSAILSYSYFKKNKEKKD